MRRVPSKAVRSGWCPVWGLLAVACGSDGGDLELVAPRLEASVRSVDFGVLFAGGAPETRRVLLRNAGAASLRGLFARPGPGDGRDAFRVAVGAEHLPPGGTTILEVTFDPAQPGLARGTAEVTFSGAEPGEIARVTLVGEASASALSIRASALRFGPTVAGSRSVRHLTVTNESDRRMEAVLDPKSNVGPCGVRRSNTFCFESTVLNPRTGAFVLGPGERTEIGFVFEPRVAGVAERGLLEIAGPRRTRRVQLEGSGVETALECSPSPIELDRVAVGSCVRSAVRCVNRGNRTATIIDWSVTTDVPGTWRLPPIDYPVLAPVTVEGASGGAFELPVEVCPRTPEVVTGDLHIDVVELSEPQRVTVPLVGSGGGADLEVSSRALDFGEVSVAVPMQRELELWNEGGETLDVRDVRFDGPDADAFRLEFPGGALPAGARRTVHVEFGPRREGTHGGFLVLNSNDAGEPQLRVRLFGSGRVVPPCRADVDTRPIDFGVVSPFHRAEFPLVIENESEQIPCIVSGLMPAIGSHPSFELHPPVPASFVIEPGATWTGTVRLAAVETGPHSAVLRLGISDRIRPSREIPVQAEVFDDVPLVTPRSVDFGVVAPGCAASRTVRLVSLESGEWDLRTVVFRDGTAFRVSLPPPEVSSEVSAALDIELQAREPGLFRDVLEVVLARGERVHVVRVPITARVEAARVQYDVFDNRAPEKLDVLFALDDSGCNVGEQYDLIENIDLFFDAMAERKVDFRIGVTTSDMFDRRGELVEGAIIASEDPRAREAFREVIRAIGLGSGLERHLDGMLHALAPGRLSGAHRGLRRPDAALAVWVMGDEPDQSTMPPRTYVDALFGLVPSRDALTLTAVSAGRTSCTDESGTAAGDDRLPDAVAAAGGLDLSICAPIRDAVVAFTDRVLGRREVYPLSRDHLPGTLRVFVGGERVPARDPAGRLAWWYDSRRGQVVFNPVRAPDPAVPVALEYEVRCAPR